MNSTQSSVLSPQSFDLSTHNFERICIELLRKGHHVKFRAPGGSMYPTILNGDEITVEPINPESITVGDIVLYRNKNGVIAHRVLLIKNKSDSNCHAQSSVLEPQSYFTLRGDAALVFDDPVIADHILGKVTLVERKGRRIDPYSFTASIRFKARRLFTRLKRTILFQT